MIDRFSRKAKFEEIKHDMDAVEFHAAKYLDGSVYPLAKQCFQLIEYLRNRGTYQIYLDQKNGEYGYVKPIDF